MRLKIGIVGVLLLVLINGITIKAAPKTMPDGGVFDPEYYAATYPDVKAAFGTNESLLYQHYLRFGKAEGRQPFAPGSTVTAPAPAAGATVQTANAVTPEQAVSIAYQGYINKGMASDAAFAQVQANLATITSLKTEVEIVQYVNGTTSALQIAPTVAMQSAVKKAQRYLNYTEFSETALLKQLLREGFTQAEAEYGVANCGANWYEQAAKRAAKYISRYAPSREHLIGNLTNYIEGYTRDQAEYAAIVNGY